MDEQRIALENAFILENRLNIARFGPEQFAQQGEKGVVLVQPVQGETAEVRYLTISALQNAGLVGKDGPPIQQSVTQALEQYDPYQQIVLVFLYAGDGTVYLLDIEELEQEDS
ncbi:MAG: hypothetical protein GYB64_18735 [Chloroflexi bacterium]|nr:hypothetical protein [Chloroflexota bacterium]